MGLTAADTKSHIMCPVKVTAIDLGVLASPFVRLPVSPIGKLAAARSKVVATPDAGTHSFGYDSAGNLRTRNWPNARAVTLGYDALDRPLLEEYGSGVQVAYTYDSGVNGGTMRESTPIHLVSTAS